jgi:hypothetical protein
MEMENGKKRKNVNEIKKLG